MRPATYTCSKCGGEGHNAQRCYVIRAYSPPPITGGTCGKCGVHGHDGRKCFAVTSPEGPRAVKNQCTYCMGFGHGSHRCPQKRVRACETCGVEIGHGARKQCVTCYRETNQRAMRVCTGCGNNFRPTRSDSAVCIGSVECLRLAKSKVQAMRFQSMIGMRFGALEVVEHRTEVANLGRQKTGEEKMTKQKGWLESNLEDQEFQRLLAREDFIEDFLNEIDRLMTEKRMTRAELARRMDCRPSHVTQLFRRTRNLTAASMVDLAFHLGVRLRVVVERGLQRE